MEQYFFLNGGSINTRPSAMGEFAWSELVKGNAFAADDDDCSTRKESGTINKKDIFSIVWN